MRTVTFHSPRRRLAAVALSGALAIGGAALLPVAPATATPVSVNPTANSVAGSAGQTCIPESCPPVVLDPNGIAVTYAAPGQALTVRAPLSLKSRGTQWLRDGVAIDGTTDADHYTVQAADLGHNVSVLVTGEPPDYPPGGKASDPVTIIEEVGTIRFGNGFMCLAVMPPYGVTWTYQWYRDGQPIPGATDCPYGIVPEDVGHQIWKIMTVTPAGGEPSTSLSVYTVPAWESDLTLGPLAGQAIVGAWVSLDFGNSWVCGTTNNPDATYTWLRDGQPIPGATGMSYTLTADDADHRVALKVSCSPPGSKEILTQTTPEIAVTLHLVDLSDLTVLGKAKVGEILVVSLTHQEGASYAYQWLRDDRPIPGETANTYTVTTADLSHNLSVRVAGTVAGHDTTATSTPILLWDLRALLAPILDMLKKWLAQLLLLFPAVGP